MNILDNNITDYRGYGIEVTPSGTTFHACQYGKRISWALNSWMDAERWIDRIIAEQFMSEANYIRQNGDSA